MDWLKFFLGYQADISRLNIIYLLNCLIIMWPVSMFVSFPFVPRIVFLVLNYKRYFPWQSISLFNFKAADTSNNLMSRHDDCVYALLNLGPPAQIFLSKTPILLSKSSCPGKEIYRAGKLRNFLFHATIHKTWRRGNSCKNYTRCRAQPLVWLVSPGSRIPTKHCGSHF